MPSQRRKLKNHVHGCPFQTLPTKQSNAGIALVSPVITHDVYFQGMLKKKVLSYMKDVEKIY